MSLVAASDGLRPLLDIAGPDVDVSDTTVPGGIRWSLDATHFNLAAGPTLPLEAKIEGVAAGDSLLVHDAGGATTLVTVTSIASGPQTLAGLTDTVTVLTVTPNLPAIADRRQVTVYELVGPQIPFWGYAYPERLTGLFTRDLPPEVQAPGTWMHDALEVRDDWESRLLRSAAWSPLG